MPDKILTPQLEALLSYSNSITGNNDTHLGDAVRTLADGYGKGGQAIFRYSGTTPTLIASFSDSWTLADTSFVKGSSSSTSATSILASVSNKYATPTIEIGDKDVIIVQKMTASPVHSASASKKAMQIRYAYCFVSYFSKRKTNNTSARTTRQTQGIGAYINDYYNTSGTRTRVVSNYGFYMTPTGGSVGNSTAASTTVRISSPTLYYRVSTSYETAANIKLVTECNFEWRGDIYLVDPFSSLYSMLNEDIDNLIVNGI